MPIEILQKEVQVRDPTTHQFSDLAALRGGQGPQGLTGPGVPAGGSDGDVLVKNGAADYVAKWEKPQYCRPNLLDNWYFIGGGSQRTDISECFPINQRKQLTYETSGKCIDRWKFGNGNLTLQSTGLRFNQNSCFISQHLSNGVKDALDGKTLTFSYLDSNNHLITGSAVYRKQPADNIYFCAGSNYQLLTSTTGEAYVWCNDPAALLSAVKLELGSYQTLAHNEGTEANPNWVLNAIPEWSDEQRKCLRYYVSTFGIMQNSLPNYLTGNVTFPVPMAATPTITITDIRSITGVVSDDTTYAMSMTNEKLTGINSAAQVFTANLPYYVTFTAECEE